MSFLAMEDALECMDISSMARLTLVLFDLAPFKKIWSISNIHNRGGKFGDASLNRIGREYERCWEKKKIVLG